VEQLIALRLCVKRHLTIALQRTVERLSIYRFSSFAAAQLYRCVAKISVEAVVWELPVCVQNIDEQCVSNSEIRESMGVVQGCPSSRKWVEADESNRSLCSDRFRFAVLHCRYPVSQGAISSSNTNSPIESPTRVAIAQNIDFTRHFQELGVEGSILIYDSNSNRVFQHNPSRNTTPFLPHGD